MGRGILVQHHSHHRTARALLAMRRARPGRCHQPRAMQMQLRDRVAQGVAMMPAQMFVKVLHRETTINVPVQTWHPLDLSHRRAPR
jgi:hypothetical protein